MTHLLTVFGDPLNIRRSEPEAVLSPSPNLLIDLRRMFSRFEGKGQITLLRQHLGDFFVERTEEGIFSLTVRSVRRWKKAQSCRCEPPCWRIAACDHAADYLMALCRSQESGDNIAVFLHWQRLAPNILAAQRFPKGRAPSTPHDQPIFCRADVRLTWRIGHQEARPDAIRVLRSGR